MVLHEKNKTCFNKGDNKNSQCKLQRLFQQFGENPHSTDNSRQDLYKPLTKRNGLKHERSASDRTRCVKQQHTLSSVATIQVYSWVKSSLEDSEGQDATMVSTLPHIYKDLSCLKKEGDQIQSCRWLSNPSVDSKSPRTKSWQEVHT